MPETTPPTAVLESDHASFVCAGCDRRVGSNTMTHGTLRAMTGYEHIDGVDWCPQCAAALLTVAHEPEQRS